jgi:hypothetical protein
VVILVVVLLVGAAVVERYNHLPLYLLYDLSRKPLSIKPLLVGFLKPIVFRVAFLYRPYYKHP